MRCLLTLCNAFICRTKQLPTQKEICLNVHDIIIILPPIADVYLCVLGGGGGVVKQTKIKYKISCLVVLRNYSINLV